MSSPVTEDKTAPSESKDALTELRKTVARLDARTAALHRDINALSHFVCNTQAMHTELMSRLCDQVFRISDILNLLPVAQVNADSPIPENAEDDQEEEGGSPFDGVYRDQIL